MKKKKPMLDWKQPVEQTLTIIEKRIYLSAKQANDLRTLAREHNISEDQIVAKALDILFSVSDILGLPNDEQGWSHVSEQLIEQMDYNDKITTHTLDKSLTMTYEEFLEWADADTLTEWVDGEVIIASPGSDKDRVIREYLHNVLRIFVSVHKLGIVRISRFQMKLPRSGREPDLLFVATEHLDRLKATYLDGPANMVVEISSPANIGRDRGEKFCEYEQAGISEYWLIDPVRRWAEFYRLSERRRYQAVTSGDEGVFRSHVIQGFWLRIEWLWEPQPILQTLRDLGIITHE